MGGLKCGVTRALLGVLLLGAARLPRGAGECGLKARTALSGRGGGLAGARRGGLEGRQRRRVQTWGEGRTLGMHGWRGDSGTGPAPGRAASGAVAVPSRLPTASPWAQTEGRGGVADPGGPRSRGTSPAPIEKGKKSAQKPSPGTCPRWRAARRGALPGLPRAPGQVGRVWGSGRGGWLFPLAHPPPPRLGQREGASKQGIGARISDRVTLFPVRTHTVAQPKFRGINRTPRRQVAGHGDRPTPHCPARRCPVQRTSMAEGGPQSEAVARGV